MFLFRSLSIFSFCLQIFILSEAQPSSVTIKALTGLKYDIVKFNVKPGAAVTLTLNNVSDMAHNLLITKPGARESVVKAALDLGGQGPEMNFTPRTDDVLFSLPIISPGQTSTITFKAPQNEGVYPYVCTYPGHGFVMFGEMHVTNNADTKRVEAAPAAASASKASPHPYELVPPYLYHVFIDGASPAAVAVRLPKNISYCWDMTSCSLRYAWSGGFIDMNDLWKGHFDASAKITGEIFYRTNEELPIRTGDATKLPVVRYKGYKLINRYPEFHYTVNGVNVYELIKPKEDGYGLIREFRMPDANANVSIYIKANENSISYESSAGKSEEGILKLSAIEAKQFSITVTSYNIAYKGEE